MRYEISLGPCTTENASRIFERWYTSDGSVNLNN